jgi:hypothetical protein
VAVLATIPIGASVSVAAQVAAIAALIGGALIADRTSAGILER